MGSAEDILRYGLPEGQDPAAILAVLAPNGYVARIEEVAEARVLVIASGENGPVDRASVRALISQASTTIRDPAATTGVHFLDEVA